MAIQGGELVLILNGNLPDQESCVAPLVNGLFQAQMQFQFDAADRLAKRFDRKRSDSFWSVDPVEDLKLEVIGIT